MLMACSHVVTILPRFVSSELVAEMMAPLRKETCELDVRDLRTRGKKLDLR